MYQITHGFIHSLSAVGDSIVPKICIILAVAIAVILISCSENEETPTEPVDSDRETTVKIVDYPVNLRCSNEQGDSLRISNIRTYSGTANIGVGENNLYAINGIVFLESTVAERGSFKTLRVNLGKSDRWPITIQGSYTLSSVKNSTIKWANAGVWKESGATNFGITKGSGTFELSIVFHAPSRVTPAIKLSNVTFTKGGWFGRLYLQWWDR